MHDGLHPLASLDATPSSPLKDFESLVDAELDKAKNKKLKHLDNGDKGVVKRKRGRPKKGS